MKHILIYGCLLLALAACTSNKPTADRPINQYQVIGSHNSYKQAIEPALMDSMIARDPRATGLQYSHIGLGQQLDLGLRNLEIDVYADSLGGRYAHPAGLEWVKPQTPYDPDSLMMEPGFKVFHMIGLDFRSSCPTLKIALQQLKDWSDANPGHFPVFITMEVKGPADQLKGENSLTAPEQLTPKTFERLDSALRAGLGDDKLITPDWVRGDAPGLNQAITGRGWPRLSEAAGRFLFILDDGGAKRDLYMEGHPSLKGRVLFVCAKPGTPEAATLIINNPADRQITDLAKQGYLIRTRADSNTVEARNNDYTHFEEACRSGAQIITTDYYQPSNFFKSSYHIAFADSTYVRVNPLFL
jgi:hypothetical protein